MRNLSILFITFLSLLALPSLGQTTYSKSTIIGKWKATDVHFNAFAQTEREKKFLKETLEKLTAVSEIEFTKEDSVNFTTLSFNNYSPATLNGVYEIVGSMLLITKNKGEESENIITITELTETKLVFKFLLPGPNTYITYTFKKEE